jgi:anti-sigma regulatory factor (Ser/Thr protein kinase)
VIYVIRDPGQGFSLDDVPHAAISNPPDEPLEHTEIRKNLGIRPGGFGILLTRNLVDDVIYSEKGNEVLLIKFLEGQSAARA